MKLGKNELGFEEEEEVEGGGAFIKRRGPSLLGWFFL